MYFRIIAIIMFLLAGHIAWAETTVTDTGTFGAWKVIIKVDDFEGEVKPTLVTDIHSPNGNKIGSFSIGYFVSINGQFNSALVSISIKGLDGTWPECDYEYTKYKIDESSSSYFPTRGYACPSLTFGSSMANKFKRGKKLKFTASGKTGEVDLAGFTKAWDLVIRKLKNSS
jgi:hypothetical protein